MSDIVPSMRVLADPTRLRLVVLLSSDELSVNELQIVTRMGQSRISTHLGQLQNQGFLVSRREGKRVFYQLLHQTKSIQKALLDIALQGARELDTYESDLINLKRVLERRQDQAKIHFNQVAGRFDRSYGPGRSWQAFGQLLLRLIPTVDIADLGSGEGLLAELIALKARSVIAVDNSPHMVAFGARKARENGISNLEFRLGDLSEPPIDDDSVDVVILSQALHHAEDPQSALLSAFRILRPGGRVLILDLLRHGFEEALTLYGDTWLGFEESELQRWLENAGFGEVEIEIVAKEDTPPHFQTLLAHGVKPCEEG
ncbi:MAG: metalloregulator ArsR/SmtB family transcription factor [Verrucomicrobiota bacterium]|nr:metalloregulator ArsR/SmtB family transcription factor [Verrucomicrobiota bacterium]